MRKYACMLFDEAKKTGEPLDCDEFFRYVRQGAELGDVTSMRLLGECYAQAIGTPCDISEAIRWNEKVIECRPEEGEVLNELGHLYLEESGMELTAQLKESVRYYSKAAECGYEKAVSNARLWSYVLKLAESGELTEKDELLVSVFEMAVSGNEEAQVAFSGSTEEWAELDQDEWRRMLSSD